MSRPAPRRSPVIAQEAGEGPPLLLLHGLAGSARWWQHNLPALTASFRVRAVDFPGFGTSHRRAHFDLDRAPAQVVRLMDREGIERAHLMGHSMGGLVAGGLAAEFPARVDRLVLVDAGFLALDRATWHRLTGLITTAPRSALSILPVLVEDTWRSGPWRMLEATVQLLQADWNRKLPLIRAPTLVIWGEHDRVCPPVIGRRISELVPDARLVIIPGAAHNPMWERPARFDREVLDFLRAPRTAA